MVSIRASREKLKVAMATTGDDLPVSLLPGGGGGGGGVYTGHWDGHHLTSTSTSAPFFDHPTAAPRGDPSLLLEFLNFGINSTMK